MKITQSNKFIISSLLEELEEHYPNHIPLETSKTIEDMRFLQGQQSIIQHIRNLVSPEETEEDDN